MNKQFTERSITQFIHSIYTISRIISDRFRVHFGSGFRVILDNMDKKLDNSSFQVK